MAMPTPDMPAPIMMISVSTDIIVFDEVNNTMNEKMEFCKVYWVLRGLLICIGVIVDN
jgi:hypothetical protein